jgi:hypothetical protein
VPVGASIHTEPDEERPVIHRTPAERLDHALEGLAEGDLSPTDPELRPLLETALLLERSLAPVPASDRFEEALAGRLAERGLFARNLVALRHPSRLVVTGAVSSAAVGCLAAFALWRGTRRSSVDRLAGH